MKRKVSFIVIVLLSMGYVFSYGFYESHKRKGNTTVHAKSYWSTQVTKINGVTESFLKSWHDDQVSTYLDDLGLYVNNSSLNNITYVSQIILPDGLTYRIYACITEDSRGCIGSVFVDKFNAATDYFIPERIWSRYYKNYGDNNFNDIYQMYEKKVNEYLTKIK